MNIYEFIKLSEIEKGTAIWDGEFLAERFSNEQRYALYHLGEFFVEVEYNPKKNKLISLRPFKTKKLLEPYLHQIDINKLIGN